MVRKDMRGGKRSHRGGRVEEGAQMPNGVLGLSFAQRYDDDDDDVSLGRKGKRQSGVEGCMLATPLSPLHIFTLHHTYPKLQESFPYERKGEIETVCITHLINTTFFHN